MRQPRAGADRGHGRRVAVAAVAVPALLVVVAIASRAHRPGSGEASIGAHAPRLLGDYVATLALITLPLGALLVMWSLAQRRRTKLASGSVNWRSSLLGLVVFAVLLGAGIRLAADFHSRREHRTSTAATHAATTTSSTRPARVRRTPAVRTAHFRWLPVFILASVGFALVGTAVLIRLRRVRETEQERAAALAAELRAVLGETLDDLHAERDPRLAVIAAYARMERTLAAYGLPRTRAEAPLEYLARVLAVLQASGPSVRRLTSLFERAKFSQHPVGASMKTDAIEALDAVRAELLPST
jgi:hypothetical protein